MTKYYENGVFIYPSIHDTWHITYTGLLKECGADKVYAHVGHGRLWNNLYDFEMEKTDQGFELTLPLPQNSERVNFCFKDSANNWDNNSGHDYSFLVPALSENIDVEIAEDLNAWDNLKAQYQTNVTACKTALSRWLGGSD